MSSAFSPEIAQVTSNTLEAEVRSLLPSVSGFGSRLGAQNVIVPVIDLTQVAGGSALAVGLQEAWDMTTGHDAFSGTSSSTIISTPGFWKIDLTTSLRSNGDFFKIELTDGVDTKIIWQLTSAASGSGTTPSGNTTDGQFIAYLATGVTCIASLSDTNKKSDVWYRQVADSNGVLSNPQGFSSL